MKTLRTHSDVSGRPGRERGIDKLWNRIVVAFLAVAWMGTAAAAGTGQAPGVRPAEFFIERISVREARTLAPEIILAESLLEEGRVYSEQELSEAVRRIVRLPLVLGADFTLEKGSERGRYELVITVEEASRWIVGLDITNDVGEDLRGLVGLDWLAGREPLERPEDEEDLLLGWRTGVGRFGVLGVALDPFDGGRAEVGYTHYDLFDRSIQLALNLGYEPLDEDERILELRRARLDLGIPIRGNHSILVSASMGWRDLDSDIGLYRAQHDEERLDANLSWVFNTLDDPVFPTSGRFVRAGVGYHRTDSTSKQYRILDEVVIRRTADFSEQTPRLFLVSDRYRRLSSRQSVSLSLDLAVGRSMAEYPEPQPQEIPVIEEFDVWRGEAAFGYQRFLWRRAGPRWRELRWETELGVFHEGTSPNFDLPWNPRSGVRLSSGLGLRTPWGVFRYLVNFFETDG